jgi:predicted metal-dependent hydrolase
MKKSEILPVEGIGNVNFVDSPHARRVVITIRPRTGVRVSIPRHCSVDDGINFIRRKEPWISKHLAVIAEHQKKQESVNQAFLNIDKKEARKTIKKRLRELARKNGFTIGRISMRNQRTRWGSCSSINNISLNYKLAILPQELVDYVIFHELVHTKIHHHGVQFWTELDKYVPEPKKKAKTLTEHGLGIL